MIRNTNKKRTREPSRPSEGQAERIAELFPRLTRAVGPLKPPSNKSLAQDLTLAQARCLWAVARSGNCTLGELSDVLDVRPSTASELVDRLVRGSLVRRATDKEDRRIIRLTLSARGSRMFQQHQERRHERIQRLLDKLSPAQRVDMVAAFETLSDVLDKVERQGLEKQSVQEERRKRGRDQV